MKMMGFFAFCVIALTACMTDDDDLADDVSLSEEESALGGSVACSGFGGKGSCTATAPAGWTGSVVWSISSSSCGTASIASTGQNTASWACRHACAAGSSRTVTAAGIGSATVKCKAL